MSPKRFTLLSSIEEPCAYTLFALHSAAEGYKIAFQFNQHLSTQFAYREDKDKDASGNLNFERYVWQATPADPAWELISNSTTLKDQNTTVPSLFEASETKEKGYLIDRMKQVDFWLKVPQNYAFHKQFDQLDTIQLIYEIKNQEIKQSPNLIFD